MYVEGVNPLYLTVLFPQEALAEYQEIGFCLEDFAASYPQLAIEAPPLIPRHAPVGWVDGEQTHR